MYIYIRKRERFTYSGDPSVANAEIGAAWCRALPKVIIDEIEPVYITGLTRPSRIVSVYSTITFLRHDFMVTLIWIVIAIMTGVVVFMAVKAGII
jgi:hypothetical protein